MYLNMTLQHLRNIYGHHLIDPIYRQILWLLLLQYNYLLHYNWMYQHDLLLLYRHMWMWDHLCWLLLNMLHRCHNLWMLLDLHYHCMCKYHSDWRGIFQRIQWQHRHKHLMGMLWQRLRLLRLDYLDLGWCNYQLWILLLHGSVNSWVIVRMSL